MRRKITLLRLLLVHKRITRRTIEANWPEASLGPVGDRNTIRRRFDNLEESFRFKVNCDRQGFYYAEEEGISINSRFGSVGWAINHLLYLCFMTECEEGHLKDRVTCFTDPVRDAVMHRVLTAVMDQHRLSVRFTHGEHEKVTWLEPWGLYLDHNRWLIVARSSAHPNGELKVYELGDIEYAELRSKTYVITPQFDVRSWLVSNGQIESTRNKIRFKIHVQDQYHETVRKNPINATQVELKTGQFEFFAAIDHDLITKLKELPGVVSVEVSDDFLKRLTWFGNRVLFNGKGGAASA